MKLKNNSKKNKARLLQLLQNKQKFRKNGFMVFVRSNDNLAQIQEICMDQSWNDCRTARYEGFIGENFFPTLFMKFINDLNLDRYKKKKNVSQNTVVG